MDRAVRKGERRKKKGERRKKKEPGTEMYSSQSPDGSVVQSGDCAALCPRLF
jgi:hypothetical protein